MNQTVELFCGQEKPFSRIAEALGYTTFTVDPNEMCSPSLAAPIHADSAPKIPANPLVLWAAPPYSEVFNSPESWATDGSLYPCTDEAEKAITVIRDTIGLLTALNPTWWFIEHPKSIMRKMPLFAGFNRGYPTRNRRTLQHKHFGGANAGLSDVWTNAFWWLPNSPDDQEAPSASSKGTGRLPAYVYAQTLEQLDTYMASKQS